MEKITKYKNEVSGAEFTSAEECRKSEAKSLSIEKIFSFWKDGEKATKKKSEGTCEFSNGGWAVQRSKEDLEALTKAIIKAVTLHEPGIIQSYYQKEGLLSNMVNAQYLLGRILSDGNSPIWHWLCVHGDICPTCFREYGQMYYAINCKHDNTIPVRKF